MDMEQQIGELNRLVTEFRTKYESAEAGRMTKAEFATFEAKITPRIDALETQIRRPGLISDDIHIIEGVKEGQKEYRKSFMGFVKKGTLELCDKAQKYMLERKALVADATGEILIPEELESEIYRALPKINVIREYALVQTTIRDRRRRRSLTEVTMAWGKLETGGVPPETDVIPSEEWQHVEDLNGLAKIGKDELADTDTALEATVIDSFSRAKAEIEETGFMVGTGHTYQQPDGILNGTTVTRVTTAAADAIAIDDMLNLCYAVPRQYRKNGIFFVPSTTELALRKLRVVSAGPVYGEYLWQPSVQAGKPATFAGYPIENQEDIPAIGASLACDIAVFGDLRAGYRILDRQGMTLQRLIEKYATAGMVGILVGSRVTGGVIRADAIRVLREHT
jgi:HK97 family phage major capsid protein